MKTERVRKTVAGLVLAVALLLCAGLFLVPNRAMEVEATDVSMLSFIKIKDSDGTFHYRVNVSGTYRTVVEHVVIPSVYRDTPVTEIKSSGFATCTNLKSVVLPESITKIGASAFINCTKLETIHLGQVESIGKNAFINCHKLQGLFLPETLTTVGTNVVQNANTIYVESAEEALPTTWDAKWRDGHTGLVVYNAQNTEFTYSPVEDEESKVIGYDLVGINANTDEKNIVVYTSVQPEGEETRYPVLNIGDGVNSVFSSDGGNGPALSMLTVKHDEGSGLTPTVNLRDRAFAELETETIRLYADVVTHTDSLTAEGIDAYVAQLEEGDYDIEATDVFSGGTLQSITLPSGMLRIGAEMFSECTQLEKIYLADTNSLPAVTQPTETEMQYGYNLLPQAKSVGETAFQYCTALAGVSIPLSVEAIETNAFVHLTREQYLFLEREEVPESWDGWLGYEEEIATVVPRGYVIVYYAGPEESAEIRGDRVTKAGEALHFTVRVKEPYAKNKPVVTVNGTEIDPTACDEDTYTYSYTVENVQGNVTVAVAEIPLNPYEIVYRTQGVIEDSAFVPTGTEGEYNLYLREVARGDKVGDAPRSYCRGHHSEGWRIVEGKISADGYPETEKVVYEETYIANQYDMEFHDGFTLTKQTITYGEEIAFPAYPDKAYLRYTGWYWDSNFTYPATWEDMPDSLVDFIPTGYSATTLLYAKPEFVQIDEGKCELPSLLKSATISGNTKVQLYVPRGRTDLLTVMLNSATIDLSDTSGSFIESAGSYSMEIIAVGDCAIQAGSSGINNYGSAGISHKGKLRIFLKDDARLEIVGGDGASGERGGYAIEAGSLELSRMNPDSASSHYETDLVLTGGNGGNTYYDGLDIHFGGAGGDAIRCDGEAQLSLWMTKFSITGGRGGSGNDTRVTTYGGAGGAGICAQNISLYLPSSYGVITGGLAGRNALAGYGIQGETVSIRALTPTYKPETNLWVYGGNHHEPSDFAVKGEEGDSNLVRGGTGIKADSITLQTVGLAVYGGIGAQNAGGDGGNGGAPIETESYTCNSATVELHGGNGQCTTASGYAHGKGYRFGAQERALFVNADLYDGEDYTA